MEYLNPDGTRKSKYPMEMVSSASTSFTKSKDWKPTPKESFDWKALRKGLWSFWVFWATVIGSIEMARVLIEGLIQLIKDIF